MVQPHPETSPDEYLFHYTSKSGLLGILGDNEPVVWATRIQYLNDGRELQHGLEVVGRYLEEATSGVPDSVDQGLLRALRFNLHRMSTESVCVASFSASGDLLSQWRGYCRAGDAYSIGFPTPYLRSLSKVWTLKPCIYDEQAQLEALAVALDKIRQMFICLPPSVLSGSKPGFIDSYGFDYMRILLSTVATFKHESFREEQEWRLISLFYEPLLFREGRHTLIPYVKLPLPGLSELRASVTVGATQYPGLAQQAVAEFARLNGLSEVSVYESKSSFRDW